MSTKNAVIARNAARKIKAVTNAAQHNDLGTTALGGGLHQATVSYVGRSPKDQAFHEAERELGLEKLRLENQAAALRNEETRNYMDKARYARDADMTANDALEAPMAVGSIGHYPNPGKPASAPPSTSVAQIAESLNEYTFNILARADALQSSICLPQALDPQQPNSTEPADGGIIMIRLRQALNNLDRIDDAIRRIQSYT